MVQKSLPLAENGEINADKVGANLSLLLFLNCAIKELIYYAIRLGMGFYTNRRLCQSSFVPC